MIDALHARIVLGLEVAREAGLLLQSFRSRTFEIYHKGQVDLVTEADKASEKYIADRISSVFPDDGILAEEGTSSADTSGIRWIIDPLDGTTNFAHGYPVYAVSIGLERRGTMEFGIVYDPARDELFVARRGTGARMNGKALQVSKTPSLDGSLLVTGFPYDVRSSSENNLAHFARFSTRAIGVRRTGSAALDLCYVAAGRFDGFWEFKLRPWDTAAGWLMVLEAEGRVTDGRGKPYHFDSAEIVASNGHIHKAMIETLLEG